MCQEGGTQVPRGEVTEPLFGILPDLTLNFVAKSQTLGSGTWKGTLASFCLSHIPVLVAECTRQGGRPQPEVLLAGLSQQGATTSSVHEGTHQQSPAQSLWKSISSSGTANVV